MATTKKTAPKSAPKTAAPAAKASKAATKAAAAPAAPATAPKAEASPAAKKGATERDKWGNRAASKCAAINGVIGKAPQSAAQIIEASGQAPSLVRAHLHTLMKKGFVERTDKGYQAAATK